MHVHEHGHVHVAVLGRVSVGKSSLLNALLGREVFSVSPLHGETQRSSMQAWREEEAGGVYLIDTPGLDEAGGEEAGGAVGNPNAHESFSLSCMIVNSAGGLRPSVF